MLIDKLKYLQGYVRIKLRGYAPERFLNLCSNHNILIWNLECEEGSYVFCISVKGLKSLKPILKKTRTMFEITERHGVPFYLHRYRKRKAFAAGIALCLAMLYIMSLFVWKIEIKGNQHRTDEGIIKFLEENHVYHGMAKSKINCEEIEELLRTGYDDIIWASAEMEGTLLIINIQENLAVNRQAEEKEAKEQGPLDIVADKDAIIYSILTRQGIPVVENGKEVKAGEILVEGKIPVPDDNGETASFQYCVSDADILGITEYGYKDVFPLEYNAKVFTGKESNAYSLQVGKSCLSLPEFKKNFLQGDTITEEYNLKLGKTFYLPVALKQRTCKEYKIERKKYGKEEAKKLAEDKLEKFCEKLTQKGIQIMKNNVMIVTDGKYCKAEGSLKVIEKIGKNRATVLEEVQERQITDESDGEND